MLRHWYGSDIGIDPTVGVVAILYMGDQPKGLQCNFNSDIVQLYCPTIEEDAKIFTYSWGEAKNPGRVSEFPTKF